jgi:predicted SAM-dependent methyltransferase
MILLDVGCGTSKINGAIGVDCRRTECVDVIADVRCLPFKDNSVDLVSSFHVIEHFGFYETDGLVKEWARVIRPGGRIDVRCPWLRMRALIFAVDPSFTNLRGIFGGEDYAGNFHKRGFTFKMLKQVLNANDIAEVRRVIRGKYGIPYYTDMHVTGVKRTPRP